MWSSCLYVVMSSVGRSKYFIRLPRGTLSDLRYSLAEWVEGRVRLLQPAVSKAGARVSNLLD